MYKVKIISIFPDSFPGILGQGVIGKAHSKKIWSLKTIDPRKYTCLLYTSPSPRDRTRSRMPSSA